MFLWKEIANFGHWILETCLIPSDFVLVLIQKESKQTTENGWGCVLKMKLTPSLRYTQRVQSLAPSLGIEETDFQNCHPS